MSSYDKLFKNSIVFALGSLGSRIVSIALLPLYTYYLSTSEYGSVDLVTTTVNTLIPIVSFSMFDAVMRFVMDRNTNTNSVLSNSIFISLVGIFISILAFPVLSYFNVFEGYLIHMYVLLIVQIFERLFAQYTRGIGKSKIFALNGILLTLSTGVLNVLLLVVVEMGISGYLISYILANLISILYLCSVTKLYKNIDISTVNKDISKALLVYAIPLIPTSIMWSAINASSRYFVLYFVGISANGLLAVASKIPLIINIVSQVFSQAWQISAIEEHENENISEFYTTIFANLSSIMFNVVSFLIIVIKPLFHFFFSTEYYNAWEVSPFLLLGAVFSAFSSFLGATYIATKDTGGVFKTSIIGGVMSIILNFALMPTIGIVGSGISSMLSFYCMYVLRLRDTQKNINIKVNKKQHIISLSIILIQIIFLFIGESVLVEIIINFLLFLILSFINKNIYVFIKSIILKMKKAVVSRK